MKKNSKIVRCAFCGKDFVATKKQLTRWVLLVCSRECGIEHNKREELTRSSRTGNK